MNGTNQLLAYAHVNLKGDIIRETEKKNTAMLSMDRTYSEKKLPPS